MTMLHTYHRRERGQALLTVTLSLVLICGMLGLVVDLGWGFFVKKSAQAATDAAALAAARKAYSIIGQQGNYTCGPNLDCQLTATACSDIGNTSNLHNGCQYAQQNFNVGSSISPNLRWLPGPVRHLLQRREISR